jgi:hypothetical protein
VNQQFNLIIQHDKTRAYRMIRIFLLLANAVGMAWLLVNTEIRREKLWPAFSLVAIALFFLFTFVDVLRKKYSYDTFPRLAYIWCAIAWSRSPLWWLAPIMIIFFILDILAHRPLIIKVTKKGIAYPSLIEKNINWADLSNVLLKDGMLTIDFRNNRLLQLLIANAESDVNEKDFNEFCKGQMKSATPVS